MLLFLYNCVLFVCILKSWQFRELTQMAFDFGYVFLMLVYQSVVDCGFQVQTLLLFFFVGLFICFSGWFVYFGIFDCSFSRFISVHVWLAVARGWMKYLSLSVKMYPFLWLQMYFRFTLNSYRILLPCFWENCIPRKSELLLFCVVS